MFDIRNTPLPDYTPLEDKVNSITHMPGVPLCVIGLVLLIKNRLAVGATGVVIFAAVLYMASTLLVFAGSAVYHWMKPSYAKRLARILDHCNIYVMISGNVTAFFLNNMRFFSRRTAVLMIAAMWLLSAVGMLLTFMDLKRFNIPQIFMYVGLGWAAVFAMRNIYSAGDNGRNFVLMVLAGGASITLGTVLYLVGKLKKLRYFHAVFHVFVLLGAVIMFIGTYKFNLSA